MESAGPYVITLSAQKPKILSLVPNDPTSRYKTRQLQVQVVGKSKMIKTMLVNILDVAKDMQVPPSYIGTFMGYEIGAQAKWDAGKPERQQAYITGEHDTKDLSGILLKFLTEVVLCPVCGLPELLINFEIKNKVAGKCRACGNNSELPITSEKFRKYIIKNPPSGNTKGEKAAFAGNKAAAAAAANSKKESKKESSKSTKTKKEAKKKGAESDEDEDEDGVIWFSDTSAEAARKRQEEMVPKSIEEKQIEMEVEEVTKLLKESTAANLADRLKQIKATHGKAFYSRVFSALFGSATDLQAEAKTNLNILKAVVTSPEAQLALLSFLETLAGTQNVALASKIALVLKDLYDNDLIEEEQILKWDSAEMNPVIKEKAAPFIKWLKEAEEESEEEEEEDSDE